MMSHIFASWNQLDGWLRQVEALHGLEWFIASAPPDKAFVTCDAPVIITPPPNHSPLMGVGLTTPGSEKIIRCRAALRS